MAARAAARRMAALLGEAVGGRVGYSVRGDSRRSAATRIEVVTTGLLVRRLQADPELPGVDAVVLDECHERHLDTDLALAFCLDVRAALRPDLRLLAMSATAQAQRLAALLGGDGDPAPVVEATGALHDVDVVWAPPSTPVDPPHGLRVDPRLLDARRRDRPPGAGRADRRRAGLPARRRRDRHRRRAAERARRRRAAAARPAAGRGAGRRAPGRAPPPGRPGHRARGEQPDRARRPRRRRRRAGPGAAGRPLPRAGVAGHRAGVAGGGHPARRPGRREGPGAVYRCWTAAEHDRLPAHDEPEVATADLTAFALELACWGAPGGRGLALLDPPAGGRAAVAEQTLRGLGAVDDEGRATARGRALTAVGVHPRLARALLDGAPLVGRRRAAEVVALLSGDTSFRSDDLGAAWREPARRLGPRRHRPLAGGGGPARARRRRTPRPRACPTTPPPAWWSGWRTPSGSPGAGRAAPAPTSWPPAPAPSSRPGRR